MHKKIIVASLAALLLNACVVAPAGPGAVVVAPPLPTIVELDVEPYYYYGGYYYYYDNSRWRYANSRSGPWVELPRSHYPRETRFKGRGDGWRGDDRDRRFDRDDDRRGDRDKDRERERRRKRDDDRRHDDDDDRRWDRDDDRR